jgi:O-antigen ligase
MSSAVAVAPSIPHKDIRRPGRSSLDSFVLLGALSLLLFAPLAFGAVESWAIFVLETWAAALFALWAIHQAVIGKVKIVGNVSFAPMLAFGGLLIFQIASKHTAYLAATKSALLLYCSYGLLCFLLVQCLRRTWQVKAGAIALSAYGFALATFSLIQDITSNGKLYWICSPRFGGWIYGPYVNHNHYAGLMEMLFPIPLIIFLSPRVQRPHKIMAVIASAVMASTIFLCGSRGGMLAFAVQIALLASIFLRLRERGRTALAVGVFLVLSFAFLAWIGGGELVHRMARITSETRTELSGELRLKIDGDCLKMFAQKPITGWGLGVFAEVYPQFRSFYSNLAIDQAHNDYFQFLVETGAVGFAIIIWFLFSVYRMAIMKLRVLAADLNTEVALASLLGVTGILVHSLVDFNLQIPANALLFLVMCTAAGMEPGFGANRGIHHRPMAA